MGYNIGYKQFINNHTLLGWRFSTYGHCLKDSDGNHNRDDDNYENDDYNMVEGFPSVTRTF